MTFSNALRMATQRLREAGVENARLDAEIIAARVTGLRRLDLLIRAHESFPPDGETHWWEAVARRCRREPLQYITGVQEFMGLVLRVTPDVLIPRAETECLVEAAAERVAGARAGPRRLRILDVGTGCGAVGISLAHLLPTAHVVATDVSAAAVAVAEDNARRLGVADRMTFMVGDLLSAFGGGTGEETAVSATFDFVVCNLPYVPTGQLEALQPEVRCFEPRVALDGGVDGLDVYRRLATQAARSMSSDSLLLCEVGVGQARSLATILERAGFRHPSLVHDLMRIERVVVAQGGA